MAFGGPVCNAQPVSDAEMVKDETLVHPGVLPCYVDFPLGMPDLANTGAHSHHINLPPLIGASQLEPHVSAFQKSLTSALESVGDREVELALWQDLEREQGIEAALRQRLAILEAEILECTESEQSLRSEQPGLDGEAGILGSELDAMCADVEKLRSDNLQLQEQLTNSETKEAELSMELWQMRIRLESTRAAFRCQYQ